MSDVRVPREAIEAIAQAMWDVGEMRDPSGEIDGCGCRAPLYWAEAVARDLFPGSRREVLEDAAFVASLALPFLRAQWEADLLGDKAIERVARKMVGMIGRDVPYVERVRRVLEAALGSCVWSEGEEA